MIVTSRLAHTTALKSDVPTERHDRWQSAAKRKDCSVADWIIVTLDQAASEELSTATNRKMNAAITYPWERKPYGRRQRCRCQNARTYQ